jgi:hypothetical protein
MIYYIFIKKTTISMIKYKPYRKVLQPLHATFLDCRSGPKTSTKIYFTIFGAKMSKLWILETLLSFSGKHFI